MSFEGATVTFTPYGPLHSLRSHIIKIRDDVVVDLAGNRFAGLDGLAFTTLDPSAPVLIAAKPEDGQVGVRPDANIVLTFNEQVTPGTGSIHVLKEGGATLSIAAADATQVTFKGAKVTVNPSVTLDGGGSYHVRIDADAITDRGGAKFAGLTSPTDLDFVTLDKTRPTLIAATPATGATGVDHAANIVLTLSEAVRATTGTVELWRADTKVLAQSIAIDDAARVSVSGSVVTIDPAADLADGASYYVKVSKGALVDLSGNAFAGVSSAAALRFTIADTVGPSLVSARPADDAAGLAVGANLILRFNETLTPGSGSLHLVRASDGGALTIAISDATQATVSGKVLTINPIATLSAGAAYMVVIDHDAVRDVAGNAFAGIPSGEYGFTTKAPSAPAPAAATALQAAPLDPAGDWVLV